MFDNLKIGDLYFYKWNENKGVKYIPVLIKGFEVHDGVKHVTLFWSMENDYARRNGDYNEAAWKYLKLVPAKDIIK